MSQQLEGPVDSGSKQEAVCGGAGADNDMDDGEEENVLVKRKVIVSSLSSEVCKQVSKQRLPFHHQCQWFFYTMFTPFALLFEG